MKKEVLIAKILRQSLNFRAVSILSTKSDKKFTIVSRQELGHWKIEWKLLRPCSSMQIFFSHFFCEAWNVSAQIYFVFQVAVCFHNQKREEEKCLRCSHQQDLRPEDNLSLSRKNQKNFLIKFNFCLIFIIQRHSPNGKNGERESETIKTLALFMEIV